MERDELNRMLAWLDLRNDAVFNKIPPDRYRYYLDNALAAGAAAAQEFAGQSIRTLYQQHDIDIQFDRGDGLFFTVQFRAQFEFSEKKAIRRVTLYQPSLESLQASSGLPLEKIIDIHLAHEFFHFLEYSRKQPVGETLEKVCNVALGPLRRYSTVAATSEIAAHHFCQLLNDLPFYPTYYDFQWLVESGKQTRQQRDALFAVSLQEIQQSV
ncbi:hypothetical protein [Kluyvera sichuanensis]